MKILVLLGKSGVGKDTCFNHICKEYDFNPIISYTSRPMRQGESQGKEYNFISKDDFIEKINCNEFLEYRSYNTLVNGIEETWYYGTLKSSFEDKNNIIILDYSGLKTLKEEFGDLVTSIYIKISDNERERRAKLRDKDFCQIEWDRRLKDDEIKFFNAENDVDYIIENINFNYTKTHINIVLNEIGILNG